MRGVAQRILKRGFWVNPGNRHIVGYGESLMNENGHDGTGYGMPKILAILRPGIRVRAQYLITYEGGIHADHMRTALFEPDTVRRTEGIVMFWIGSNDANDGTLGTAKAQIDLCTAALFGGSAAARCLILGPLAGNYPQIKIGGANRPAFDAYIAAMSDPVTGYGDRFCDINSLLISHNDGSPGDLADVAEGIVPRSLRCDDIHPNIDGYGYAAEWVDSRIISKGW